MTFIYSIDAALFMEKKKKCKKSCRGQNKTWICDVAVLIFAADLKCYAGSDQTDQSPSPLQDEIQVVAEDFFWGIVVRNGRLEKVNWKLLN